LLVDDPEETFDTIPDIETPERAAMRAETQVVVLQLWIA